MTFDYSSDDEEEKCPLCIEDMDITDKSFKPCPCGFQICQFCYNKIRSGPEQFNRCPACRRPYDDESVEYTMLTPEDLKREQERKQRKEQERKQREREKQKEQSHALHGARDKKHLASMRVIQKNLVYVIGLNPNIPSEELQQMLRRDEYFGQYGKIQKIVVNKRVNGSGHPGVGVYVTFARKEDAARCIAAVDGSINDGKYLRAAYGTTKYCSSYLRGQNCPNPNCMFLHEPGEEADSFNRPHVLSHPGQLGQLQFQQPPLPQQAPALSPSRVSTPLATQQGLAAATTPALAAWGKVAPQVPPVHKISEPTIADDVLPSLTACLSGLRESYTVEFVAGAEQGFPAMFSLPMDEKRRLKTYHKAVAELDRLSQIKKKDESRQSSVERALAERASAEWASASPSTKNKNSQHLLAQLMNEQEDSVRAKEDKVQTVKEDKVQNDSGESNDGSGNSNDRSNVGSNDGTNDESNNESNYGAKDVGDKVIEKEVEKVVVEKKEFDWNAAKSVTRKLDRNALQGKLADTLRKISGELMQPPAVPLVSIPDNTVMEKGSLVDDGPAFNLRDLPLVPISGDALPSVWAALEDLTHLKEQLGEKEKEYLSAKALTKKRTKRLRV